MKLVSFKRPDGSAGYGVLEGEMINDVSAVDGAPVDLKAAIEAGVYQDLPAGPSIALSGVTLLPVVPNPDKVLCVGLNYETHRLETGRDEAGHPAIFTRYADSLIAHGAPILRPVESEKLDYEGELAVVILGGGRRIPVDEALNHVAGYACFNDGSIRDWQRHNIQFTPGKNFPHTGPFGPYLLTPDEAGDLSDVHVVTKLNGQVVQDQPISDMLFDVATIISYISTFTELKSGDVIATGTPGGVGAKRTPPLWMKPGDTVEIDIGPLGKLVNRIEQEVL